MRYLTNGEWQLATGKGVGRMERWMIELMCFRYWFSWMSSQLCPSGKSRVNSIGYLWKLWQRWLNVNSTSNTSVLASIAQRTILPLALGLSYSFCEDLLTCFNSSLWRLRSHCRSEEPRPFEFEVGPIFFGTKFRFTAPKKCTILPACRLPAVKKSAKCKSLWGRSLKQKV